LQTRLDRVPRLSQARLQSAASTRLGFLAHDRFAANSPACGPWLRLEAIINACAGYSGVDRSGHYAGPVVKERTKPPNNAAFYAGGSIP
jgi:hypothetical protein